MIAEVYMLATLSCETSPRPCTRWWATDDIMGGGSINPRGVRAARYDALDREMIQWPGDGPHLRDAHGIAGVLNAEIEQSDAGKGFDGEDLCECGVVDCSDAYPAATVLRGVRWAGAALRRGSIYVHCHAGGGRSAAFVYAILRAVKRQSRDDALRTVRAAKHWRLEYQGQVCLGSITEWPAIEWGDPRLGSGKVVESVERTLSEGGLV